MKRNFHGEMARKGHGVITATSPCTVLLDGAATSSEAFYNALYTPTIGDNVAVEFYRGGLWVDGKQAGP